MFTVINGVDMTDYIPRETLLPTAYAGDQLPQCDFDVVDIGSQLAFDTGMEVIVFDENAPRQPGAISPTIPSHNCLSQATNFSLSPWATSGILGALINTSGGFQITITFTNNAIGTALIGQTILYGYIHPGQKYMLSAYVQASGTITNIQNIVEFQWLDASQNVISTISDVRTPPLAQTRISISGTAPSNAAYAKVLIGGQTTNTTNSGVITIGTPQFEPMWFASRGVSYPSPDCNYSQVGCSIMPDGTISRTCRIFAGYIDDFSIDHTDTDYAEGPSRTWHIQVAGLGAILENATVTQAFEGQTDAQIIQSVVSNEGLETWMNVTVAPNSSSALPVQTGATIDAISFNENTMRDVLNSLTALSGFIYYFDWYGTLYYLPAFYSAANFSWTDAQPDNMTTFSYYDFHYEKDATQQKWDIVVIGGKFISGAITDNFTGNGSNKTFNLTQQPYNMHSCTVGGSAQKVGVQGRDKNGVNGIQALYDKTAKTITFNSAPGNGVAVVVQYTFEAPAVVECIDASINKPVSPVYALPPFQSKVHDTNLTSIAAATTRGLQELNSYSKAKETITHKSQQYAYVGQVVYFTASRENIINQPYVIQEVDSAFRGNGTNEFSYTLGYYRPRFTDHSRNIHKATHRSTTTAAVDVVLQTDLVISEQSSWSETITVTPIGTTAPALIYGSGTWGGNSW